MKRNYGIDIARVLAMFMVVVVHNLSQGGVLKNTTSTLGFLSSYEIFNISIVAVNIFALITINYWVSLFGKWYQIKTSSWIIFRGLGAIGNVFNIVCVFFWQSVEVRCS